MIINGENYQINIDNSLRGFANTKINESGLFENNDSHIKVETIHGCKGMCLDSIFFISSQKNGANSSGGFWGEWFDRIQITEKNRLAFVAFSRAKYLLVLGIPETKSFTASDKIFLQSLGFEFVE